MILYFNLLNNNFLSQDFFFYGVFTVTLSIIGYLIFIIRLGSIIISYNKRFKNLKQSIY